MHITTFQPKLSDWGLDSRNRSACLTSLRPLVQSSVGQEKKKKERKKFSTKKIIF
jgi:hypothetical protein